MHADETIGKKKKWLGAEKWAETYLIYLNQKYIRKEMI